MELSSCYLHAASKAVKGFSLQTTNTQVLTFLQDALSSEATIGNNSRDDFSVPADACWTAIRSVSAHKARMTVRAMSGTCSSTGISLSVVMHAEGRVRSCFSQIHRVPLVP